jgi:hypothetical protein
VKITSTGLKGEWRQGTGTSDSTAIASGVAALVWSKFPNLSAAEVLHRLEATAIDKGRPGLDPVYGYGVIDPVAALTADVPPPSPTATPKASPTPLPSLASPQSYQALPAGNESGSESDSGMPGTLIAVTLSALILLVIIVVAVLMANRRRQRSPFGSPGTAAPSVGPPPFGPPSFGSPGTTPPSPGWPPSGPPA